jgi:hypothetical protein
MNMFGTPVQSGTYTGMPISVAMSGKEFVVYVLKFQGQPSNQAPVVYAGLDQTIHQPTMTATLAGTVSDDGLPQGASVTATWSMVSGPAAVTFGDANSPATAATFTVLGTYVLRLTASDTALSGSDDVQITVAAAVPNQAPVVNAGSDQSIRLPVNTASLSGTVSDDGLPLGASVTATWSKVSGPGTVTFASANAVGTTATFSTIGTYVLRLTASDTALTGSDDMQVTVQAAGTLVMALHLPFDEGSGTVANDTSGNGRNGTLVNSPTWIAGKVGSNALQFNETSNYVTAPGFALPSQFSVAFWFADKTADDPLYRYMFSWGPVDNPDNINIWIYENTAASTAVLRTNIEPDGGADRTNYDDVADAIVSDGNWHHYCATVGSGGLTVYLDGNQRVTDAAIGGTFTLPGNIYIGGRSDLNAGRFFGGKIDDVRIYSQALVAADVMNLYSGGPANVAPTANASTAYPKVMIPNALTLTGTISDDGLPNGTCTAAWSMVSGPGTVAFANPAAASTTATFSTAGTYMLQLTASDSVLTGTSNVTVTVLAPADFNGDGKVDGVDFLIWQSHYPTASGATPDGGDANGDGKVDGVDFLIWQANYHG